MLPISLSQFARIKHWVLPERPGPLVGLHLLHTAHGTCLADRWPDPRFLLVETGGNYSLLGAAEAVSPADLRMHVRGFVEAGSEFAPVLKEAFQDLGEWARRVFTQPRPPSAPGIDTAHLRRLSYSDARALASLSAESAWIWNTWDGPDALAASGFAWGAFAEERLVSVACTFFLGERFEDIGVVTEPGFRARGLSTLCAAAMCRDIHARGRIPSWTTSPDNLASLGAARKLGFTLQRQDVLYAAGVAIPHPG